MPKSARKWIYFAVFVQVVWSLPLAVLFGYKWLARDEPNVTVSCDHGTATCSSGETVNMILTLVFGAIVLIALVIGLALRRRWSRADAREQRLRATGERAPAMVVAVRPTNSRINNRPVLKATIEVRPRFGAPFTFQVTSLDVPPPGTPLTAAYDPADPADAIVVDDLAALRDQATRAQVEAAWQLHPGLTQQPAASPPAWPPQS